MLNPCCCVSPRIGCFVFGIIDLLCSISQLSIVLSQRDYAANRWVELAVCIVMIILAIVLIYAAVKNSIEKLQLWLVGWTILIILFIIAQVFNLLSHHQTRFEEAKLVLVLIFLYELWVVYAFIHELKYGSAGLTYCPAQVV